MSRRAFETRISEGVSLYLTRALPLRLVALALTVILPMLAAPAQERVTVIPLPSQMKLETGSFALSAQTRIEPSAGASHTAGLLSGWLLSDTGLRLPIDSATPARADQAIVLRLAHADSAAAGAYSLHVSPERVEIESASTDGLIYGCQTLRQLLRQHEGAWTVPAVDIEDQPRLRWRGLMLDCSRTFIPLEYLRRTVDWLSFYKLNVLHLHLTDDQGWRIEIKQYPKLTTVGSRFAPRFAKEHGGYYSQQELRDLVQYAAERGVTIVPEIEMPGHSTAALAAYPELSCTGGPFEVFPFFSGPGITEDVICPGNERTFEFLQGVLQEVADIFPGRYIHMGGDECPITRWRACPKCRARIVAEHLPDAAALHSYFVKRIAAIVESRGKTLIGWDEIAQGDVAKDAAVMFWRGLGGVPALTKAGHDVVLSPTSHCYFDYRQSDLPQEQGEGDSPIPLDKVYSFDPVPAALGSQAAAHILGVQANLWTHYARTDEAMDHQLFPRLIALAEVAWTPQSERHFADFSGRLQIHCRRLEQSGVRLGLNFRSDAAVWAQPAGKH